ncbi:DUF87 domain-containing protein [candidate division WWE3 bacterium]|uniref:DUF87 domain-containing protein n=1 Tax=candidate division WWE3 bacterium TaxID=2053526 RepID=A0A955EBF5_UNCKA|nr:DUF87 domain-containing protein [candidate division WWE3 bacterium]
MAQKDYVDLSKLNKQTQSFSTFLRPEFYAVVSSILVLGVTRIGLSYSLKTAVPASFLTGILLLILTPTSKDGLSLLRLLGGKLKAYKEGNIPLNNIYINYGNRRPTKYKTHKEDYEHLAKKLQILGVKDNIVKLSAVSWVALYKVNTEFTANTAEERDTVEHQFQQILNVFNNRGLKTQIIFTKPNLSKVVFENYINTINKLSIQALRHIKKQHVRSLEDYAENNTKGSLSMYLCVYFTLKPTPYGKNRDAWNEAKEYLNSVITQVNSFNAFNLKQLENLDLKVFLADLYQPLGTWDMRDLLNQELIEEAKEETNNYSEFERKELESIDLSLTEKIQEFLCTQKRNIIDRNANAFALSDLDDDVLMYMPQAIQFSPVHHYVRVDDAFEMTVSIPTNNRIVDNSLFGELTRANYISSISLRAFPHRKYKVQASLEMEELNLQSAYKEKVGTRGTFASVESRKVNESRGFLEEIAEDNEKELFDIELTVTIIADSKTKLHEHVEDFRSRMLDKLGIRVHRPLHRQESYYFAGKLDNRGKLNDCFLMDSSRISKLMPFPWFTFSDRGGFLLGKNMYSDELAFFDPSNLTESRSSSIFVLGKTGTGKSALIKKIINGGILTGWRVFRLDNTGEYASRLGLELNFKIYKVGSDDARINPFQLFKENPTKKEHDRQINEVLQPVFSIILQDVDYDAGIFEKLLRSYYSKYKDDKNFTTFFEYTSSYVNHPPKYVKSFEITRINRWITEFERYVWDGALSSLFGDSNDFEDLGSYHGVVFDISDIKRGRGREKVKQIAMMMQVILANIWIIAEKNPQKTMVVTDEAHHQLVNKDTALYLEEIAKEGRKSGVYSVLSTQDLADFIQNQHGRNIITNTYIRMFGKLDLIQDSYLEVLGISKTTLNVMRNFNVGEFFVKRASESMYLRTFFLDVWEQLICDTENTDYRKSLEELGHGEASIKKNSV